MSAGELCDRTVVTCPKTDAQVQENWDILSDVLACVCDITGGSVVKEFFNAHASDTITISQDLPTTRNLVDVYYNGILLDNDTDSGRADGYTYVGDTITLSFTPLGAGHNFMVKYRA